jgi:hypothetical protein
MATSAPASASAKAIVFPIPCLAPVTRATFPAKEKSGVLIATPPLYLSNLSISSDIQLFLELDFYSSYASTVCKFCTHS